MPTCAYYSGRSAIPLSHPFRRGHSDVGSAVTDTRRRRFSVTSSSLPFTPAAAAVADGRGRRASRAEPPAQAWCSRRHSYSHAHTEDIATRADATQHLGAPNASPPVGARVALTDAAIPPTRWCSEKRAGRTREVVPLGPNRAPPRRAGAESHEPTLNVTRGARGRRCAGEDENENRYARGGGGAVAAVRKDTPPVTPESSAGSCPSARGGKVIVSEYLIPPPTADVAGKLVIVLDLDETLVCSRSVAMYVRPGAAELLRVLKNRCEVIVWTASVKDYALSVIRAIDTLNTISHCIFRHEFWCKPGEPVVKDIRLLGRPLNRTLLIDNTPGVFRVNPSNSLLVTDFFGHLSDEARLYNGMSDSECSRDNSLYIIASIFRKLFQRIPNPTVADVMKSVSIVPRRVAMEDGSVAILNTLVDDDRDDCFV